MRWDMVADKSSINSERNTRTVRRVTFNAVSQKFIDILLSAKKVRLPRSTKCWRCMWLCVALSIVHRPLWLGFGRICR